MKISFGKYRGQEISDLPSSYLEWLLEENVAIGPSLRIEAKEEIARRKNPSAGVIKKYDSMTGENKLIEVIEMLPPQFFSGVFTLNAPSGKIQCRLERIKQ